MGSASETVSGLPHLAHCVTIAPSLFISWDPVLLACVLPSALEILAENATSERYKCRLKRNRQPRS